MSTAGQDMFPHDFAHFFHGHTTLLAGKNLKKYIVIKNLIEIVVGQRRGERL